MPASTITLCGSLSRFPVALGAAMHNAGYRALGLPFTYVPFRVSDLPGALVGMRALGIRGFGVSMPFKLDIMPLCDELDAVAAAIGAVNTVVNDAGRLCGYNTDADGAARALGEELQLAGARVLVLGAGGAARAVAYGLRQQGAQVVLSNRTDSKAAALSAELGVASVAWAARTELSGFAAVVNATSQGMADVDPASPLPAAAIHAGLVVMDIVYKPLATELLAQARRRGATTIHGGRMLLHQAARQLELYTGHEAPLAAMEAGLAEAMAQPL